jgi:hypothetical protein
MSKGYYTYWTEGSTTHVLWHGPPGKSIGRGVNSGPMGYPPAEPPPLTESDKDKPKAKRKRKKKDQ